MSGEQFPHLRLDGRARSRNYAYPRDVFTGEFPRPPRDRVVHAEALSAGLDSAFAEAHARGLGEESSVQVAFLLTLDARDVLERLDRTHNGIHLLSVKREGEQLVAVVLVPSNKKVILRGVLDQYASQNTPKGNPKHRDLVDNIDEIRAATERDLWTDRAAFPDPTLEIWWEVWLHTAHEQGTANRWTDFSERCESLGFGKNPRFMTFPERVVGLVRGSANRWATHPSLLLEVAELRRAKELATPYVESEPRFQRALIDELLSRTTPPPPEAPAVCVLDRGIAFEHPLLRLAIYPADAQAVDSEWTPVDVSESQHGTGMAGVALFGTSLGEVLQSGVEQALQTRLESVKILPDYGKHEPDLYGDLTQRAVALAEIQAATRNRAICLAITADDRDGGLPSSWSAAIDQLACGGDLTNDPKLVVCAAGNLRDQVLEAAFSYPLLSDTGAGIEDPAQSWNALTVGATTELVQISDSTFQGYQPIAPSGDLSPTSRTSEGWPPDYRNEWPFKPDIVMEGGNWARQGSGQPDKPDDLGLLTTAAKMNGGLFSIMRDTSPAAAATARLGAQIWAKYPQYWPETVRGLIVHSARWTPAMLARFPGKKTQAKRRLRCVGYGQPVPEFAFSSAAQRATMIYEGEFTPYQQGTGGQPKYNQMHLHPLPLPQQALLSLGAETIHMRVTLSYFIAPSPGRRGWKKRHRYASHGLRFCLQRPGENEAAFLTRVSKPEDDAERSTEDAADELPWAIGSQTRTKGSIHSDLWEGTAAELATCQNLVVHPVTGWWKELKRQKAWNNSARYSLVVSIESASSDVYSLIENEIMVSVSV